MSENINLNRQVFERNAFERTVDTSFSQLVPQETQKFFDTNLANINDFFVMYEKLFYEIPKQGEGNSHEYLITQSSEYINFQSLNEEIQALLDEISSLREDLLESNKLTVELQAELSQLKVQ
tara:strand:+ start:199 stop:564 length:366 start_codon:yes stop_codon:yes gene_type:complete